MLVLVLRLVLLLPVLGGVLAFRPVRLRESARRQLQGPQYAGSVPSTHDDLEESPGELHARELEARAFKCLRPEAVRGRALVDFAAAAHEVEQEARFAVALGTRARERLFMDWEMPPSWVFMNDFELVKSGSLSEKGS